MEKMLWRSGTADVVEGYGGVWVRSWRLEGDRVAGREQDRVEHFSRAFIIWHKIEDIEE